MWYSQKEQRNFKNRKISQLNRLIPVEFIALSSVLVNFDRHVFDQHALRTALTLKGTEEWKNLEFKGAITVCWTSI